MQEAYAISYTNFELMSVVSNQKLLGLLNHVLMQIYLILWLIYQVISYIGRTAHLQKGVE